MQQVSKCFVPVPIETPPTRGGWYNCFVKNEKDPQCSIINIFYDKKWYWDSMINEEIDIEISHWLEERTDCIVCSAEDIEDLVEAAKIGFIDATRDYLKSKGLKL
jgi:hypothetical protein